MGDAPDRLRLLLAGEPALAGDHPHAGGALQRLCRTVARQLPATGVAVSVLSLDGSVVATLASDPASTAIEEVQFAVGEGPGPEALAARRPVLVPDLAELGRSRWPGYGPAARAHGVRSVFAFPLQVGAARLGVMSVHRDAARDLSPAALADALVFADLAVDLLLDGQQRVDSDPSSTPVDDLLGAGFVLYQAQGMVMVQLGVSLGEAMSRLRAHAFAENRPLGDVAAEVVARRLALQSDRPVAGTEGPIDPPVPEGS